MVQPDFPNDSDDEWEAWVAAATARISAAGCDDIDDQVNREILRYWHDRVQNAGDNAEEVRRIRAEIARLIQIIR